MKRLRAALALAPLLLAWPALRHAVEARMSLHMLLEFPLLLGAGLAAARLGETAAPRLARALAWIDHRGWTAATWTSLVALAWMVPSALDAALLSAPVEAAKLASWWLAGALLAGGVRRMDPEVLLFTVGNLAWMAATAGLLYLDAPLRLCVAYLEDDQRHAGVGLVALAVGLGAFAVRRALAPAPRATARA